MHEELANVWNNEMNRVNEIIQYGYGNGIMRPDHICAAPCGSSECNAWHARHPAVDDIQSPGVNFDPFWTEYHAGDGEIRTQYTWIRAVLGRWNSLNAFRISQFSRASSWLVPILNNHINDRHNVKAFVHGELLISFTDVDDIVEFFSQPIPGNWEHSRKQELIDEICEGWLSSWADAYGCGNLRQLVRELMKSGDLGAMSNMLVDKNQNHFSYYVDLLQKFYNQYRVLARGSQPPWATVYWSEESNINNEHVILCPACTVGIMMMKFTETQFSEPESENYQGSGYLWMQTRVRCTNESCGLNMSLDDYDDRRWQDSSGKNLQGFVLEGIIWAENEHIDEFRKKELDLDDLMQDEYFLTWVH